MFFCDLLHGLTQVSPVPESQLPPPSLFQVEPKISVKPAEKREETKPEEMEAMEAHVPSPGAAGRPTSPASPTRMGILTPGVVERHLLPEPPLSPTNSTGSASKLPVICTEEDATKRSVKTLFVQCFKDDLFQERQLLMSQINNLFKLRNNGEALQYKDWAVCCGVATLLLNNLKEVQFSRGSIRLPRISTVTFCPIGLSLLLWFLHVFTALQEAGYEKLHNFLADVPGLSLIGAGNRMELKLGDRDAFDRFSDDLLEGREVGSCA